MTPEGRLSETTSETLFEDAPCGYLTATPDGVVTRVNRTFERLVGRSRDELVGSVRFPDLLAGGGRIYYETHVAPLVRMQGFVREIAVEVARSDHGPVPALVSAVLDNEAGELRIMVFEAQDRRRYEREILDARFRERDIAQGLQRSLLAGPLPESECFDLGVGYRPAEQGTEAGGDWYDAFWTEPGQRVTFVVGDVVGRGLGAAAAMGQLRSAVRALSLGDPSPASVIAGLDRYVVRHDVGLLATVVVASVDLADRTMCVSCAGHPPALLLTPGESPRYCWEARGLPLDAQLAPEMPRSETKVELAPCSVLVLYTDGLIEHHDVSVEASMDRLAAAADSRRSEDTTKLAADLLHAMRDTTADADDACVLAARLAQS